MSMISWGVVVSNPDVDFNLYTRSDPIGPNDAFAAPTYVGCDRPTTLQGFALTDDSRGKFWAEEGDDMGAHVPLMPLIVGPQPASNTAPSCDDVALGSVSHASAATGSANCSDLDSDALTYAAAGVGAAHGMATVGSDGKLRYEADPGFAGSDTFH